MGCSQAPAPEYQTQATKASLVWDGQTRTYQVHVPANLATKVPLVLVLHGAGGSGAYAARYTSMNEVADREGFLAVYPDGTAPLPTLNNLRTWNAAHCCGGAYRKNIDDVGFLAALIKKLTKEYPVDPKRVYVVGHSNGARHQRLRRHHKDYSRAPKPGSGGHFSRHRRRHSSLSGR